MEGRTQTIRLEKFKGKTSEKKERHVKRRLPAKSIKPGLNNSAETSSLSVMTSEGQTVCRTCTKSCVLAFYVNKTYISEL